MLNGHCGLGEPNGDNPMSFLLELVPIWDDA